MKTPLLEQSLKSNVVSFYITNFSLHGLNLLAGFYASFTDKFVEVTVNLWGNLAWEELPKFMGSSRALMMKTILNYFCSTCYKGISSLNLDNFSH